MEKTTLKEISNWKKEDDIIYHNFEWVTTYERKIIINTLNVFIKNHPEYNIKESRSLKNIKVWKKV